MLNLNLLQPNMYCWDTYWQTYAFIISNHMMNLTQSFFKRVDWYHPAEVFCFPRRCKWQRDRRGWGEWGHHQHWPDQSHWNHRSTSDDPVYILRGEVQSKCFWLLQELGFISNSRVCLNSLSTLGLLCRILASNITLSCLNVTNFFLI